MGPGPKLQGAVLFVKREPGDVDLARGLEDTCMIIKVTSEDIWQHLHQQSGIDGIVTINYKELIC